eukprot:COSAG05_NODE_351_length_10910_cov_25.021645_15_plen_48_part_00
MSVIGRLIKMSNRIKDENGNEYQVVRHDENHIYAINIKLLIIKEEEE